MIEIIHCNLMQIESSLQPQNRSHLDIVEETLVK